MKKLVALAALVCSATFAKAQFATFRVKDNTGFSSGIYCAVFGNRYPGGLCIPDNISEPPTLINTATYTVFTPAGTVWAYTGATVLNGIIIQRPDGMGNWEPAGGMMTFCGPVTSTRVIKTTFATSGTPVTITITPVGTTQLDFVLTP